MKSKQVASHIATTSADLDSTLRGAEGGVRALSAEEMKEVGGGITVNMTDFAISGPTTNITVNMTDF